MVAVVVAVVVANGTVSNGRTIVVVAVATFEECLEWRALWLPLLLQTGPTVSNEWTIVVVAVATFDECLERRALLLPLLLQTGPTVSNERTIVVVVVAIFSNVSSGAICCWQPPGLRSHNFTKARASKWSKVAILPRPDGLAEVPSANNNILLRI